MSIQFENALIDAFKKLKPADIRVNVEDRHLFVCGGTTDATAKIPPSFRDRFLSFSADRYSDIHNSVVLAESFKDYFKENAYPDLLVFEEEIANLSSLVIIFLESPGSLVELGMFCSRRDLYKKLLIIAPQDDIQAEDSFIYLGPLESIKKSEPTSVAIYPWPTSTILSYDEEHLVDICEVIKQKLGSASRTRKFDPRNSGHIALLIAEIIRIGYPLIVNEIELSLASMDLDIHLSHISRHLYLLNKIGLVNSHFYSGYRYYYPLNIPNALILPGSSRSLDITKVRMSISQSYILANDHQSRKRRSAMKGINSLIDGSAK
ncbi:MAG: retron St85 family effector protein [Candidatus Sedimenticola sp. (ex Thyasira tokunagai)]